MSGDALDLRKIKHRAHGVVDAVSEDVDGYLSDRLQDILIRQAIGSGCLKRCSRSLPVGRIDCESELENGLDLRIGRLSLWPLARSSALTPAARALPVCAARQ